MKTTLKNSEKKILKTAYNRKCDTIHDIDGVHPYKEIK
jgi:hypothetical protein